MSDPETTLLRLREGVGAQAFNLRYARGAWTDGEDGELPRAKMRLDAAIAALEAYAEQRGVVAGLEWAVSNAALWTCERDGRCGALSLVDQMCAPCGIGHTLRFHSRAARNTLAEMEKGVPA